MSNTDLIPVSDWTVAAKYFSVNGHSIAYWEAGEGPALLLIHGFPTAAWDWAKIWRPLAERYRVIALDMLGFGLSDKPKNIDYDLKAQADLQLALLAHLGVTEAHILTHDYGVSVTQELLARQNEGALPIAIPSVCFLNGGLFPGEHRPLPIQKLGASPLGFLVSWFLTKARFEKSFASIFGAETQASPEEIEGFWHLITRQDGHKISHKLLRYMNQRVAFKDRWIGALLETKTPLRFINGPEDPISGGHVAEYYRKTVPLPDVVVLPGIGHYPQVESPTGVLDAFFAFQEQITTRTT